MKLLLNDIGEATIRILGFNSIERLLEQQTLYELSRYPTPEALQRNIHKTNANYLFEIMRLLSVLFLDDSQKILTNGNKKEAKKESIYSTDYHD